MAIKYPLINGVRHDYSSVEISIKGARVLGVKDVNYSSKLDPGKVTGTHAAVLGRTRGQLTEEGSLTLYEAEWSELLALLGNAFMEKSFNITVNYREDGQPMITDRLIGCRLTSVEHSPASGSEPITVKLSVHIMRIQRNGFDPVNRRALSQ
jgi:hypothetical protein